MSASLRAVLERAASIAGEEILPASKIDAFVTALTTDDCTDADGPAAIVSVGYALVAALVPSPGRMS